MTDGPAVAEYLNKGNGLLRAARLAKLRAGMDTRSREAGINFLRWNALAV